MPSATFELEPSILKRWFGGMIVAKIWLSNEEVQSVTDAASPISAFSGLIVAACGAAGPVGPAVAAVIASTAYLLTRANRKHGNRGVVVRFRCGPGMGIESLATIRFLPPPDQG